MSMILEMTAIYLDLNKKRNEWQCHLFIGVFSFCCKCFCEFDHCSRTSSTIGNQTRALFVYGKIYCLFIYYCCVDCNNNLVGFFLVLFRIAFNSNWMNVYTKIVYNFVYTMVVSISFNEDIYRCTSCWFTPSSRNFLTHFDQLKALPLQKP